MSYAAELAVIPCEARHAQRRIVNFVASVRDAGATVTHVRLRDVSPDGCKVAGLKVDAGAQVWIKIPGANTLTAQVAWADGDEAGLHFSAPLDMSTLAALNPAASVSRRTDFGLRAAEKAPAPRRLPASRGFLGRRPI
jgi:hypothetical protein